MSDHPDLPRDEPGPPMVIPVGQRPMPREPQPRRPAPPPPPPRAAGSAGRVFLVLFLLASLGLNFLLILVLLVPSFGGSSDDGPAINEKYWSNDENADDKVAVIRIDGVLMDDLMGYAHKQIDKAIKDNNVKAVVLRINSPGGTVSASEDLHTRLKELRYGNSPRFKSSGKPLVASMGAIAASGGYYIAMPAQHIFADEITNTGSIGVYLSLPNVHDLAKEHGVKMNLIKAGEVKDAGSMFHELAPAERQQYQDSVDAMYGHFLKIVEDGRPQLKGKLTKVLVRKDADNKVLPDETFPYDEKGNRIPGGKPVPYKRKLADGGIFTAREAKQYDLIDTIGTLDEATKLAAQTASLTKYKVVVYERPVSLLSLFGVSAKQSSSSEFAKIAAAATPRLWYMAPNSEFAGMFSAMGRE